MVWVYSFNKDSQWSDISTLFKDEETVKAYGDESDKLEAAFAAYIAMDPWSRAEGKPQDTPDGRGGEGVGLCIVRDGRLVCS